MINLSLQYCRLLWAVEKLLFFWIYQSRCVVFSYFWQYNHKIPPISLRPVTAGSVDNGLRRLAAVFQGSNPSFLTSDIFFRGAPNDEIFFKQADIVSNFLKIYDLLTSALPWQRNGDPLVFTFHCFLLWRDKIPGKVKVVSSRLDRMHNLWKV